MPRTVAIHCPHHITQRGNARQAVFVSPVLCEAYLDLLKQHAGRFGLGILAYCLMTNHVHIVAVPEQAQSLARTFRHVNGRFAQSWNTLAGRDGHLWQNRFYSCPVEPGAAGAVIRYVERNPVRAGMAERPEQYPWSSAAVHVGMREDSRGLLDLEWWSEPWGKEEWAGIVSGNEAEEELAAIRRATYTGRPLGSRDFVGELETKLKRRLAPARGGRPKKLDREDQLGLW